MINKNCSGVILAGGKCSRMGGENKAFLRVDGERIIDRTVRLFNEYFDEVIVVTNTPVLYSGLDVTIVSDLYESRCSLAGLHAGLFYAANPWIFVAPCDNPFLKRSMIELVLDHIDDRFSVVVPETEKGLEPLCAAYGKNNLHGIEQNLSRGLFKISRFFKASKTRKISEKKVRGADPRLSSFFNINRPEDLGLAKEMCVAE